MITETNNNSPDTTVSSTTGLDKEIKSNFSLDRYLGDQLVLPYTFQEVRIKSNEMCIADNINASLYKLHFNFLYLNAQTKVAANNFPEKYKGYIASTEEGGVDGANWYKGTNALSAFSNAVSSQYTNMGGTILSGIVDGVFTESLGTRTKYVGFLANSGALVAVQSENDDSQAFVKMHKRTIEDSTALSFTNIKQLAFSSENRLYVIDDTYIHKFDVDAVLTDNPAISAIGRFLIKTIGGKSVNIYDKDKFGNPVSIDVDSKDNVYVLDHGDNGYKVFDRDLNWITTNSRKNDFTQLSGGNVVDIAIDHSDDGVYVLVDNGIILKYGPSGLLDSRHDLSDSLAKDEKYKRFTFSKINDDILYVATNQSVYKKFKTKLAKSIGAFRINKASNFIENEVLSFIDVMRTSETTYDYFFVGANSTEYTSSEEIVGKVFKFDEKVNYKSTIYDAYKSDTYSLSSFTIDEEEYVTNWVINKSLHKLIYNHLLFRDNIHSKYRGQYDNQGRLQYLGIDYIKDTDPNLFTYNPDLNNFIGLNEPVMADVVNRPLEKIFDLQVNLLDMVNEKISNKYPYPEHVVGLK